MRRALALVSAILLIASVAGSSVAATPASGISHAYGRFLIGLADRGPIGWVTVDVREPTAANPDPGAFTFEALPGVTDYPVTTRGAIGYVDFYPEVTCCGNPASLVIAGLEVQYFVSDNEPSAQGVDYMAAFHDVGPGVKSGDFFRWGTHENGFEYTEFYVVTGSFTVDLDANE